MKRSKAIFIIGVSGSGKSTIGKTLSDELNAAFLEGDDYHPPHNVEKMASGKPLDDRDRRPWLLSIAAGVNRQAKDQNLIVSCSALKSEYRSILEVNIDRDIIWIALTGSIDIIRDRMIKRNHFMPSDLLESQFAIWEPPKNAWLFDIQLSPEVIVERIISKLEP